MRINYNLVMPDLYGALIKVFWTTLKTTSAFFEQTALNERTVRGFCPFTCTCNVKMYNYFRSTSHRNRVPKNILRKLHDLSVD
jgi:hypothetical protein